MQPGEVRNPSGKNQYTGPNAFLEHVAHMLSIAPRGKRRARQVLLAERLIDLAIEGDSAALRLVTDRVWPLVQRHEVKIEGEIAVRDAVRAKLKLLLAKTA